MDQGQGGPKLADFVHRADYKTPEHGRDRHLVRFLQPWLFARIREMLAHEEPGATVLDVGCGEQPLRSLVEEKKLGYVGMDVVQNHGGTVSIIAPIDGVLPNPWPGSQQRYPLVFCTEVMEHVADWNKAFDNLRSLTTDGGLVLLTTPFFFPLHMEPHDYFRATPHAIASYAKNHRFRLERFDKLGEPLDVLCTVAEDLSILPARAGFGPRVKARMVRLARNLSLRIWLSKWFRSGLEINSNTYLGNAALLRAV